MGTMIDYLDRAILRRLREGSRKTLVELSEEVGCSPQTVSNRIKKLEDNHELTHRVKFDPKNLESSLEYFIRVTFKEEVDYDHVEEVVKEIPYVQFAARTEGDFDLFLWSIAPPDRDEYELEMEARIRTELDQYIDDWLNHALLTKRKGFLPLENDVIDLIDIDERAKKVIRSLNENARKKAIDISRETGLSYPTVNYWLEKVKENYINGFTSFLTEPKGTNAVRFLQVRGTKKDFRVHGEEFNDLYRGERNYDKQVYSAIISGGMDNCILEHHGPLENYSEHCEKIEELKGTLINKESKALIKEVMKGKIPLRPREKSKEKEYILSPIERLEPSKEDSEA